MFEVGIKDLSKFVVINETIARPVGETWGMANTFLYRPINTRKIIFRAYVLRIMHHKVDVKFYPETQFFSIWLQ